MGSFALGLALCGALATPGWCQKITDSDRATAQSVLQTIGTEVKKHYYDPKLHGLDWDAKVRERKQRIDQADSLNRALSEVAALLDSLNDSHLYFLPPQHSYRHDYGWQAQLIGERCYVVHVRPGSDAEVKGVKPGDELVALNGYAPPRTTSAGCGTSITRYAPSPPCA
jgi:C-terminal processing protease CtpA/Prc